MKSFFPYGNGTPFAFLRRNAQGLAKCHRGTSCFLIRFTHIELNTCKILLYSFLILIFRLALEIDFYKINSVS